MFIFVARCPHIAQKPEFVDFADMDGFLYG